MKLKNNTIHIQGIRPELVFALNVTDQIYTSYGQELVITSLNDGKHSRTSLHYIGAAADLRTSYFTTSEIDNIADLIRNKLGVDYDVIVESNHIHLEFQPKYR